MRVLSAIVAPPHLAVSGAARAAEQLSAALVTHCDITVASMLANAPMGGGVHRAPVRVDLPRGLPWRHVPQRYRTLFYRSSIPDLVRHGGYDLVHIHNPMPALEMARIAAACRSRGMPYVISTHGFNEIANGVAVNRFGPLRAFAWQRLVTAPVRRAVRNAASIFALSPADIPIVRHLGLDGGDVTVVPNGVALPAAASPAADAGILKRFGLDVPAERRFTCFFLANHTPNKGLPVLLAAFDRLAIPYDLVVGGEQRDLIDYTAWTRRPRSDQRIIVTGHLTDAAVAALYRRADLFVFPTLADTFPLVVLEAMAHGVPVLASGVGGIPHQLDEGSGATVAPGDPAALAGAVAGLAALPRARLRAMGAHARTRVATHFTWERAADQAIAGYHRVVAAGRAAPMPASALAVAAGGRLGE